MLAKSRVQKNTEVGRSLVHIVMPASMNFAESYHETIEALQRLKAATAAQDAERRTYNVYVDMTGVRQISVAAALVLAAECDRWRRLSKVKLRVRDVHKWSPQVVSMLGGLGFFHLLRVVGPKVRRRLRLHEQFPIVSMVTGDNADGSHVYSILEHLKTVADVLGQDPAIYDALVEAAYNSTLHAYPDGADFKYKPIPKRWWATACWFPLENVVRFYVYDQGVGIPATLPRSDIWEDVRRWLALFPVVGDKIHDQARMISAAIDVARTSRPGTGHGQGLQDVIRPIDGMDGARVRILSGQGQVVWYGDGRRDLLDRGLHVGGTLIDWTIPVRMSGME